jgi:ubiquinone/menaquinone biosynthesis C-methylase UbiE
MMGSSVSGNLHKPETGQYQQVVNAFFHDRCGYWKDVYQEESLRACIYRARKSAVLTMVDKLALAERSRALEIGCGAGLTTVALAKRGYAVDAIDTVEAMLDLTRQAACDAGVGTRVKTSLNNVLGLTFPPQHFELVVAMGVVPWLECPGKALVEMSRVLKPGGHVILTADNNWCITQILDPLCFPGLRPVRWKIADVLQRFKLRAVARPRLHRHSVKQIDDLLSGAGLHKLEGVTLGFGPFTFFKRKVFPDQIGIKIHRKLQTLADVRFPGMQSWGIEYVVIARKSSLA